MKPFAFLALLAVTLTSSLAPAADAVKLELKDGDRVAFIGNTFVEREQVDCYIETMFTVRHPTRNITFRNLGYSADTVTGEARGLCSGWSQFEAPDKAFERLRKLVTEYKPTVLLINYGMTESFYGPEKLPDFVANYNKMLDALIAAAGTSPRLILMSPNYHEDLGRPLPDPAEHNKNLKLYSDAIADIAAKRSAGFIDLFSMTQTAPNAKYMLTTNGIHFTPSGYRTLAGAIERETGSFSRPWLVEFTPTDAKAESGATVSDVLRQDGKLTFTVQADYLPDPPMPEDLLRMTWRIGKIRVTGLAPGKYQLKNGTEVVATGTAEEWAAAVYLDGNAQFEQVETLRKLIVAKNFDYFNYQRPDNDSYILAFRKREQGRNAVEIPQFLPLVEEKEKQIAVLRVPKPVTYTLEPVK